LIFNEYSNRSEMMKAVATGISKALRAGLSMRPRATLAVAGGTTPGPIFDLLCGRDLGWERVDIMLTDERWVPENSPRSNTALLRQRLLVDKAAKARLVPLYGATNAPEESLEALTVSLRHSLPLTVVLLGMGEDMHTASIFPGADQLQAAFARGAPPLLAMRAPGAAEPRITLSAEVLNGAAAKFLVITGVEKREALEKAQELPPEQAPIRALMDGLNVYWAP